jgi:hypothetical protein
MPTPPLNYYRKQTEFILDKLKEPFPQDDADFESRIGIPISAKINNIHAAFLDKFPVATDDNDDDVDGSVLLQAIKHIYYSIQHYRMPKDASIFKVAGCFAHWISYLKPFKKKYKKLREESVLFTNEIFSVYLANVFIVGDKKYPKGLESLTEHFFNDFISVIFHHSRLP